MAKRQGLRLEKSRRRDKNAWDYGTYVLVDGPPPTRGGDNWRARELVYPYNGFSAPFYGATLDMVESFLNQYQQDAVRRGARA